MPEPGRVTAKYGGFHDQALATLAEGQHGVFDLDQLRNLGLSPRAVGARAATGRLHRIHQGVYSLVPERLLSWEGRRMAAVLACGPDAVLSHRSAAELHGLVNRGGKWIDVTVPKRSSRQHEGIRLHRSTTLMPNDVTETNGIRCTTIARTLLDLGEVMPRRSIERACDQADAMREFDRRALDDQIARNPTRRGATVLRSVLDEHYVGSTMTASEFEEAMVAFCDAWGYPKPRVNYWICLDDGGPAIKADFAWPEHKVIVETDGVETHLTRQAFERDRRKDLRLHAAGWRPARVTPQRLKHEPELIDRTLSALIPKPSQRRHAASSQPRNSSSARTSSS